jgi:hypothetical protein
MRGRQRKGHGPAESFTTEKWEGGHLPCGQFAARPDSRFYPKGTTAELAVQDVVSLWGFI